MLQNVSPSHKTIVFKTHFNYVLKFKGLSQSLGSKAGL